MIEKLLRRISVWGWGWGWFLALAMAGCGPANSGQNATQTLRVVATTAMIGDVASTIAGSRAEVVTLIGSGIDPHLFKPTRDDLVVLESADLIFYNGLHLEGKMGDVLEGLAASGKTVVAVAEAVRAQPNYVLEEAEAGLDPHVWMDPRGWSMAATAMQEALAARDPAGAPEYEVRAQSLRQKMEGLDAYARQVLGTIPAARRVLVTAHDAFGYLGRAYSIEVRGVQGLSTESEAGVRDVAELVDFLVSRQIPAVFIETSVSDKNVRALLEGTAARGHRVEIGGSLFSDAMGLAGTYEGTYLGMIDHNVTTIARALGGEAPARGWQGRLADAPQP